MAGERTAGDTMSPVLVPSRHRLAVVLGLLTVLLASCTSASATDTASGTDQAASGIRVVSVEEAVGLLDEQPEITVIDVRTPGEFAEGHLEGAVLVDCTAADFREAIGEFPRDGSYLIYCRSGNRSAGARQVMTELGFTDVADIDGGVLAWSQQGGLLAT